VREGGAGGSGALTNAIPPVLLRGGCGDGIAIVPAEEDDRTLKGGSKVEAGMGVPLTGCPLTKVTDDNSVGVGPLGCIGCPHRCTGMSRERGIYTPTPTGLGAQAGCHQALRGTPRACPPQSYPSSYSGQNFQHHA
jgi:hypothetical protein